MIRWLIPLLLLPAAALADDWHGIWSAEPEWCAQADRIGSVTPAPILLSADEMLGYENSCAITSVDELHNMNAWMLALECQSEGDVYDEQHLIMVDDNRLWIWFGGEEPVLFERCAG